MPNIYGNSEIWGDLLVTGSFSILGSASTINSTNLIISDAIISLGHSQSGSPVIDEGIMFGRGTGLTQAIIWDETNDTFALIGTNDDHTVIGSINIDSYSNLRVGGLTTSSLRLTTGASTGYLLQSDTSGNAIWVAATQASANFANTDLISTGNRIHSTNFNDVWISEDGNGFGYGYFGLNGNSSGNGYFRASVSGNVVLDVTGGEFRVFGFNIGGVGITGSTRLSMNSAETVFNDYAGDHDFRIEGDTNANLFFVDASSDNIGIGTNTPIYRLQVSGTISTTGFRMTDGASNGYILISDALGNATWTSSVASSNFANTDLTFTGNRIHDTNGSTLAISTDSGLGQESYFLMSSSYASFGFQNSYIEARAATFSIRSAGGLILEGRATETVINEGVNSNFRVSGYTESNLIFAKWDNDCVGIGTNTPTYRLQVSGTVSTTGFRMTNGSSNGYVLTSDSSGNATWQPAGVSGSGTSNYLAKWSSSSALTDSLIFDNGSVVGINGWASQHTLGVYSNVETNAILAANSDTTLTSKRGILTSVSGGGSSSFNTGLEISVQDAVNTNYGILVNTSGSDGLHNYAAAFVNNSTAPTNYGLYIDSYSASVNYGLVVQRGTSIFNESGGDYDFRIEGLTQSNLFFVDASNDNIGIGTNAPNTKSILDVSSTTKGFLPPRMTTVQREAITSPPAGLMIFNTTNSRHEGYTGTTWSGFY